jgi:hypothetical protein
MLSVFGYINAYAFQLGFCYYFGIPTELIRIGLEDTINGVFVIFGVASIVVLLSFISSLSRDGWASSWITAHTNKVSLLCLLFLLLLWVAASNLWPMRLVITLSLVFLILLLCSLIGLIYRWASPSTTERMIIITVLCVLSLYVLLVAVIEFWPIPLVVTLSVIFLILFLCAFHCFVMTTWQQSGGSAYKSSDAIFGEHRLFLGFLGTVRMGIILLLAAGTFLSFLIGYSIAHRKTAFSLALRYQAAIIQRYGDSLVCKPFSDPPFVLKRDCMLLPTSLLDGALVVRELKTQPMVER